VDRRRAARTGDRGGDRIPALRASRLRLGLAAAALLLGGALAGTPLLGAAGSATPALAALAGVSLVALLASLLWRPLPWLVLAGLGAELAVREVESGVPGGLAVAYGAALLLVCELVAWADALRSPALVSPGLAVRRAANVVAATAAGAGAAALVLAAGGVDAPNAFAAGVAGALAVAGLVAVVWSLGRRAS
jgi:hypothetical protein